MPAKRGLLQRAEAATPVPRQDDPVEGAVPAAAPASGIAASAPASAPPVIPPVFIASKGRPGVLCRTSRLLREYGVPHTIVVEPAERAAYVDGLAAIGRPRRVPVAAPAAVVVSSAAGAAPSPRAAAPKAADVASLDGSPNGREPVVISSAEPTPTRPAPPAAAAPTVAEQGPAVVPTVVALPKNDQGVGYARRYIAEELAPRASWFWMLDDDITAFFVPGKPGPGGRVGKVRPIGSAEAVLAVPPEVMENARVAMFALEYERYWLAPGTDTPGQQQRQRQQQASTLGPAFITNSYACVAVCLNLSRVPPQLPLYRPHLRVREDYDVALQLVAAGLLVARRRDVAFHVPAMGSNTGGMAQRYREHNAIAADNRRFAKTWAIGQCDTAEPAVKAARPECPAWITADEAAFAGKETAPQQSLEALLGDAPPSTGQEVTPALRGLRINFSRATAALTAVPERQRVLHVSLGTLLGATQA